MKPTLNNCSLHLLGRWILKEIPMVNYSVQLGSSAAQFDGLSAGRIIQWHKKQGICGKKLNKFR